MEEVHKIALSSNDDKRIQTFDKFTTYPYGTNDFKVCENEMLAKMKRYDNWIVLLIKIAYNTSVGIFTAKILAHNTSVGIFTLKITHKTLVGILTAKNAEIL